MPAPAGLYTGVRAWDGADDWLSRLAFVLATPDGEEHRRACKVAAGTLLRVARHDAAAADGRTGRGVATAHETVAAALGMSKRQVQRARELLERLGFSQTLVGGRYLTQAERRAARSLHDGDQRRAASVRALTIPAAVENVHLPRRGSTPTTRHELKNSPPRAQARETEAAPRPKLLTRRAKRRRGDRNAHAWAPGTARMAAGLVELPFLTPWRGSRRTGAGAAAPEARHIGQIARVVALSGLNTERFTARDVLDVLDAIARELGLRLMDASHVTSPLGYLATLLRRVSGYVDQHGWTTRAEQNAGIDAERRARRQEAARRAAEAAAERERLAAPEEQAAIEAVLEQMRRDFPRDGRSR